MKRNISLLLGTIIGILAALSFMQTYSSNYKEMLKILTIPSVLKQKVWKLPEEEGRVGSYIFKLRQDNYLDEGQSRAKIRDKCF